MKNRFEGEGIENLNYSARYAIAFFLFFIFSTYLPPRLAAVVLFCTDVCCCMDPAVPPRFVLPAMEPAVDATEPPPFTPLLLEAAVEPRLARLPRRPSGLNISA